MVRAINCKIFNGAGPKGSTNFGDAGGISNPRLEQQRPPKRPFQRHGPSASTYAPRGLAPATDLGAGQVLPPPVAAPWATIKR
jgi:hypothetical protein